MAKGHKQTVTHSADKPTTDLQNSIYNTARKAAGGYTTVGPDQNTLDAMGLFGNLANYGKTGAAALAGDQSAVDQMMNPYLSQVLGGFNAQFGHDSALLRKNVNDAATQAGAFGGDRAALEQGAQQGALGLGHMQQVAGLLAGGYNDAMARAGGLANLGLTAGGAQFQGGDYLRNIAQQRANPELMRQQILTAGMAGNAGNSTDSTYTKTGALQNIIGGASALGGLFGMPDFGGIAAGLFGTNAKSMTPPQPSQLPFVNRGFFGGY